MIWLQAQTEKIQSAVCCQSALTVAHLAMPNGITGLGFNKWYSYQVHRQGKRKRLMRMAGVIEGNQPMTKF